MSYTRLERLKLLLNAFGGMAGSDATLRRHLLDADRDICRRALAYQTTEPMHLEAGVRSYALPSYWYKTFAVLGDRRLAYLRLLDQEGTVWYLRATPQGELDLDPSVPPGLDIATGLTLSWLEWATTDGTVFKIYPTPQGELDIVPQATALTGSGTTETIELRDDWGAPWYPLLDDPLPGDLPELRLWRTRTERTHFVMYTQAGGARYVVVSTGGVLSSVATAPANSADATFHPELSWFEWASPDGTHWKVYLDNAGAFVVGSASLTLAGYGWARQFVLSDTFGTRRYARVTNAGVLETGLTP